MPESDRLQAIDVAYRRTLLDTAKALDNFLAGVERRAYRMARLATGNSEEALDIVQDAMFKLVQRYRDRDAHEWPPLFQRILQSRINDWYRRNSVRNRFRVFLRGSPDEPGVDPIQELADPRGTTAESGVKSAQTIAQLETARHALPNRQRQAFLLRVWDGLDFRDTAKAMGCSEGSVKTHYSRAVHTLRDQLGEHWP